MRYVLAAAAAGTMSLTLIAACSGDSGRPGLAASSPEPSNAATTAQSSAPTPRAGPTPLSRVTATVLPWRLPGPLSREVAMRYGGGVLLAGGLEPGDHSTAQVLKLSLDRGVTRRLGRLSEPVHDSAGAVVAGRPTLVGGGGATELSEVQQRDRAGRWRVVGQLPGARSDLSVTATGRGLLVVGGYDGVRSPTAVLRSGDGTGFQVVGHLPAGVRYAGVARSGRTVWLLGGEVDHRELTEVLSIDTRTGEVVRVGRMPRPLGHEAVVAVGGRLLVMGGRTGPDAVTDRMWWLDTQSGRWSHAGRLPFPLSDAPWVTAGNRAYLFGGETPAFTAKVTRVTWQ